MKALIASLVGLFVVLSVTSFAQDPLADFQCVDCNNYGETGAITKQVVPDELVKLDGTLPSYGGVLPAGYYVLPMYGWAQYVLPGCGLDDCIPESCTSSITEGPNYVSGYASDDSSIWMYAPHDTGCYMVVLTATHQLYKIDGKDDRSYPEDADSDELIENCLDMTCFLMCVQETACPACSAIFCDQDCGEYLKYDEADCPSYGQYTAGYLCYPINPEPAGINIVWYVVEDTAMPTGDATAIASYLSTATIVEKVDDPCFDPDVCNEETATGYGSSTFQIIMTIENSAETIVDWCPVGTLVMVEDPVAEITEEQQRRERFEVVFQARKVGEALSKPFTLFY